MHLLDDLTDLHASLVQAAEAAGLTVAPMIPGGEGLEATWPNVDDVAGYVKLATLLEARALYLVAYQVPEAFNGREVSPELLADRDGELAVVDAAFVAGGVVHRLSVVTRWYDEALDEAAEAEEAELAETEANIEQMARTVVTDPVFQLHSGLRDDAQYAAIEAAFPGLDRSTAYRVRARASGIDRHEFQPVREANWAREARRLMADGATKTGAATQLGITTNVLGRVLQQNPAENA